ncbi:MAG: TetR/AcrR family transcriptional regulator C-terminal domain-containing protein [Bauldia sp.]|nr:TetR/AcrR family transcriptional regulator C-terminal domain-containing protein [Bauldia sp.]
MAGKRAPLSAERIETKALDLIEREGLEKFSTRKLATALGCEAMSIYHYFPSKAHLMDAILDRIVGEVPIPPDDLGWRERLRQVAFGYRAMALRYPAFFRFMAHHRMNTRTALALLERILSIFDDAGFGTEDTARLFRLFSYYITGAALDEATGYAKGPSAAEAVPGAEVARDYPLVTAVNPYFKSEHHEATFALGLEMLLDGMERRYREAAAEPAASIG